MVIGMIAFWALVIAVAIWLVRDLARTRGSTSPQAKPIEILNRRLAEGAISIKDYEERRSLLQRIGRA